MMVKKSVMLVGIGLLTFLFSGCSPVPSDPHAALMEKAAPIDTAVQDALDALSAAGLDDATASGQVSTCGNDPRPGVRYDAGITVKVGDDLASGFDALVAQLRDTGWTTTDAYDGVKIDPAKPKERFSRDRVTLDVRTGGASIGGKYYGADEMTLGFTLADPCVRIPHGTSFIDFQDLDKDILPRA